VTVTGGAVTVTGAGTGADFVTVAVSVAVTGAGAGTGTVFVTDSVTVTVAGGLSGAGGTVVTAGGAETTAVTVESLPAASETSPTGLGTAVTVGPGTVTDVEAPETGAGDASEPPDDRPIHAETPTTAKISSPKDVPAAIPINR
jgi:hypothetical protein